MNQAELIAAVSDAADISKADVEHILKTAGAVIQQTLGKNDDEVSLPGLGKLVVEIRGARIGRNPKTGETLQIPAKAVVKLRPAKELRHAVDA